MAGGSGDTLPPPDLSPAGIVRHQIVALVRGPMLAMLLAKALEGSWRGLAAAWPYGDRALFVASTFAVHLVLYATCNGLAALCDSRGWLARYKMPRTRGQVPGDELVQQTVRDAAVGQTLVGPLLLAAVYTLLAYFGMPAAESPLPGAGTVWLQMVACVAFNEVGFYTMHRLLHHPALYARVHKQHHRYAGTIGIAAEFAHPVEQVGGRRRCPGRFFFSRQLAVSHQPADLHPPRPADSFLPTTSPPLAPCCLAAFTCWCGSCGWHG